MIRMIMLAVVLLSGCASAPRTDREMALEFLTVIQCGDSVESTAALDFMLAPHTDEVKCFDGMLTFVRYGEWWMVYKYSGLYGYLGHRNMLGCQTDVKYVTQVCTTHANK